MNRPIWLDLLLLPLWALVLSPPLFAAGWLSHLIKVRFGLGHGADVLCYVGLCVLLLGAWVGLILLRVEITEGRRTRSR